MVMDLNKCLGCQTCTIACKKQWTDRDGMIYMYWNNVETAPGAGYPRNYHRKGGGFNRRRQLRPAPMPSVAEHGIPFEYDYGQRLFGGGGKPVMPHVHPENSPNWDEDQSSGDAENPYHFYLPRICNHCTYPACLEACPRKAIYKREEDGIVLVDQERCRGYRHCVRACPYRKVYYNAVAAMSQKCIFCYPRLEKGWVNACATQCPGRLRFVGLLHDEQGPIHQLVHVHKVALPMFPERGTYPNVYYVPPFLPPKQGQPSQPVSKDPRLPRKELEYLFGQDAMEVVIRLEREVRRAQAGKRSEVLQLLIGRKAATRYRLRPEKVSEARPATARAVEPRPVSPTGGPPGELGRGPWGG
jgi:DMSO reductase family type II enzyme iron-sulfur subunit